MQMRVMLDGSCVEVYLESGEVLSTRIYRGEAPKGMDAGIDFVAFGGSARVVHVTAWELSSIWKPEQPTMPELVPPMEIFEPSSIMGAPIPA